MTKVELDPKREDRIENEVIVDCDYAEQYPLCWYYYLQNKCTFPFKAFFEKKQVVEITGMAEEEDCEKEMFMYAKFEDDELPISLFDLKPVADTDNGTKEAIEDWYYWINRGYQFL